MKKDNSGIWLCVLLQLVLIALKLCGAVAWSWAAVLIPMIAYVCIWFVVAAVVFIILVKNM